MISYDTDLRLGDRPCSTLRLTPSNGSHPNSQYIIWVVKLHNLWKILFLGIVVEMSKGNHRFVIGHLRTQAKTLDRLDRQNRIKQSLDQKTEVPRSQSDEGETSLNFHVHYSMFGEVRTSRLGRELAYLGSPPHLHSAANHNFLLPHPGIYLP